MSSSAISPQSVANYLRQTSKGRLPYDRTVGSNDIQNMVEKVIMLQNSLTVSPPQQQTSEIPTKAKRHNKKVGVRTAQLHSREDGKDASRSVSELPVIEQDEMKFFNLREKHFKLNLVEYVQEQKRQCQAAFAERKMAMDEFSAREVEQQQQQLEALRREKYLQEQLQMEQERAKREAVIEEKKQWEQNQRALQDQHNQRLNAKVKEAELTQKRLEQQAAERRQREIENKRNLDELLIHQKAITAFYNDINSSLSRCTHKELLPATVKQALCEQKEVAAIMDQLVYNVSQRFITPEDLLVAKQQVQRVDGYLQVVRQGVELTNRLAEKPKPATRADLFSTTTTASSPASTSTFSSHGLATGFSAPNEAPKIHLHDPNLGQSISHQATIPVPAQPSSANEASEGSSLACEELYQYVSPSALRTYTRLQTNLGAYQQSYKQLMADSRPIMKKYKFDLQKAVNIPVNAISPLSGTHVRDKLERLKRLLMGQPVEVTEKKVSAREHPQAIFMCKDLLAKKFVKQGEEQVSSKHESAFAFAATIIGLWTEMPDFGNLLLAHFHQKCPVTVPYYIPKREGQSQEDHYRAMGYIYIDGSIEKQDKFLKRMSGMVRLYAAIVCSPVPRYIRHPHPHGIENGWIWLTRILNLNPVPDLTATILFDFLETAGACLLQTYGKQFQKLLVTLCKELFPKIRQVTSPGSGGPLARLENFLQKCLQCGKIPSPEGFLGNNFWYT